MGYLVDVPIDIVSKWRLNGSLIWFYRDNHGLFRLFMGFSGKISEHPLSMEVLAGNTKSSWIC